MISETLSEIETAKMIYSGTKQALDLMNQFKHLEKNEIILELRKVIMSLSEGCLTLRDKCFQLEEENFRLKQKKEKNENRERSFLG